MASASSLSTPSSESAFFVPDRGPTEPGTRGSLPGVFSLRRSRSADLSWIDDPGAVDIENRGRTKFTAKVVPSFLARLPSATIARRQHKNQDMADQEHTTGQLFTRVYTERGKPVQDNAPFRRRLGAYVQTKFDDNHYQLHHYLEIEAGLIVPNWPGVEGNVYEFGKFFETIEIQQLLNAITLIWKYFSAAESYKRRYARNWVDFVARVFREENLGYSLDEKCGVHFLVDEEFERNRVSALRSLDQPRYAGVRDSFEAAHKYLDLETQDTKAAVRSIFESLEILTKLMVNSRNLSSHVIEKTIKPLYQQVHTGDTTAIAAMDQIFDGFAKWVDGLHYSRHGQSESQPVSPPIGFAIYAVSSGAAMLRYLVELDAAILESPDQC